MTPSGVCNTYMTQMGPSEGNELKINYDSGLRACTPLCRLCGRLDDLISEPTRAVGATVTAGTVILIGLPRMAR